MAKRAAEIGRKFVSNNVVQSGLGPAFFAVVTAFIILVLLSIFGNSYLTGNYVALTGAYHIPGGTDTVKLANITFTTTNYAYFSPVFEPERFNGPVSAIRVVITGPSGLVFKSHSLGVATREVFIVTKQLNSTALPVGSVIYFDYGVRGWKRVAVVLMRGGYSPSCNARFTNGIYLPLYTRSEATNSFSNNLTVMFVPSSQNATCIETRLQDFTYNAAASPVNQTAGYWLVNWTNYPRVAFTVQNAVEYWPYRGVIARVYPRFVSPTGSTLMRADSSMVRIQYAYDTRLR